mgnify:CR=1 FL=1
MIKKQELMVINNTLNLDIVTNLTYFEYSAD